MSSFSRLGVAVFVSALGGSFSLVVLAGQSRTATAGVYTAAQATRGQAIYKERCMSCHGETLLGDVGPPLTGGEFMKFWGDIALSELVNKIEKTMPADQPGTTTRAQAADLVAYVLQVSKFPAGKAELVSEDAALKQITLPAGNLAAPAPVTVAATSAPVSQPLGNLAQVMRGIFFPSSNLIFNVQGHDPGTPNKTIYEPGTAPFSWVDWGGGIYSGWELIDYAAVTLADAAPLLLTPGRRCENGRAVPVERADWIKYTAELVEAGRAAYKASQSRNQEIVSEVTNQIAEACLNCHVQYRDKPGGTPADPSNKAARCIPRQP